jgi:Xaa-Pro aminopeptidase
LGENQVDLIKEIKSQREVEGMIECHYHDGAALVSFLAWLEEEVLVHKHQITEF